MKEVDKLKEILEEPWIQVVEQEPPDDEYHDPDIKIVIDGRSIPVDELEDTLDFLDKQQLLRNWEVQVVWRNLGR